PVRLGRQHRVLPDLHRTVRPEGDHRAPRRHSDQAYTRAATETAPGGSTLSNFADYAEHTGAGAERFFKSTLFQSQRLLLGLNCLEPGQAQAVHDHADQDKFYFVVEGEGVFTVGAEVRTAGAGTAVWAPAGVEHGVVNRA